LPQFLFHRPAIDKLKHGHYKWGTIGSGSSDWVASRLIKSPFSQKETGAQHPDFDLSRLPLGLSAKTHFLAGLLFVSAKER
jgi:hypothetical protein